MFASCSLVECRHNPFEVCVISVSKAVAPRQHGSEICAKSAEPAPAYLRYMRYKSLGGSRWKICNLKGSN
eukprot:1157638-Pelagomonas_calceolata.AAC.4